MGVVVLDPWDAIDHLGVLWKSVRRVGVGGMDVPVACWRLVGLITGVLVVQFVVLTCVVAVGVPVESWNAIVCERFADFVGVSSGVGGSLYVWKKLAVVVDFFGVVRQAPLAG